MIDTTVNKSGYNGYDIEFKSDNFSKGPRTKAGLSQMKKQVEKDIYYKNSGMANPYWHFEHNPESAEEMKLILRDLKNAGIKYSYGRNILKQTKRKRNILGFCTKFLKEIRLKRMSKKRQN